MYFDLETTNRANLKTSLLYCYQTLANTFKLRQTVKQKGQARKKYFVGLQEESLYELMVNGSRNDSR